MFSRYGELWPLLVDLFLYTSPNNNLESLETVSDIHMHTQTLPKTTNQRRFREPHPRSAQYDNTRMKQWQKHISDNSHNITVHSFRSFRTVYIKVKVHIVFGLQSTRTLVNTVTDWLVSDITQTEDQKHLIRHFKLLFQCNNHCKAIDFVIWEWTAQMWVQTLPFCCCYETGFPGVMSGNAFGWRILDITLIDAEPLNLHLNCVTWPLHWSN